MDRFHRNVFFPDWRSRVDLGVAGPGGAGAEEKKTYSSIGVRKLLSVRAR